MWCSQLGKTIQPSDVLFNLTKFSNTLSVGIGLNHAALRDYISTNTHKTIMGEVNFSNNYNNPHLAQFLNGKIMNLKLFGLKIKKLPIQLINLTGNKKRPSGLFLLY